MCPSCECRVFPAHTTHLLLGINKETLNVMIQTSPVLTNDHHPHHHHQQSQQQQTTLAYSIYLFIINHYSLCVCEFCLTLSEGGLSIST